MARSNYTRKEEILNYAQVYKSLGHLWKRVKMCV